MNCCEGEIKGGHTIYEEVDSVDKLYGGKTERADKGFGSQENFKKEEIKIEGFKFI